ncbi:MAG: prepilin-type N-terminal cleavage/methylation domain-containing protein [Planctomycetota bacterium]
MRSLREIFSSSPPRLSVVLRVRRRAFTLLELLAALALFLMLAGIVLNVFYSANRVVTQAKANSEIYQKARSVLDVIRDDLSHSFTDSSGRFFYCGTCADVTADGVPDLPGIPAGFSVSLPPAPPAPPTPSAATAVRDVSQILLFATTADAYRLVNPTLAAAGPTPVAQVMYYLRADGALVRMTENFEAPETTAGTALLPGEMSSGRSFWMHNDLSTFYAVGARNTSPPPNEDFTTNAAAFTNCPTWQTCQVTGDSAAGLLTDDAATPNDEVNDYYLLATHVRNIVLRFYDSDPTVAAWVSSWNAPNWDRHRKPYAVHVTVEIESSTGAYADTFSELIFLGSAP